MTTTGQKIYWRARATTWGLGETSKGSEQVGVTLQVLTEGAELPEITWYGYFTEKSLPITVKALRALGWTGTDLGTLTGLDANEVDLVIQYEEWEGKVRPKVQFVNPINAGTAALKTLAPEKQKAFAAKMKGAIAAVDAVEGFRPEKKAIVKPGPKAGDIPF